MIFQTKTTSELTTGKMRQTKEDTGRPVMTYFFYSKLVEIDIDISLEKMLLSVAMNIE